MAYIQLPIHVLGASICTLLMFCTVNLYFWSFHFFLVFLLLHNAERLKQNSLSKNQVKIQMQREKTKHNLNEIDVMMMLREISYLDDDADAWHISNCQYTNWVPLSVHC